jgi:hypothetical protein
MEKLKQPTQDSIEIKIQSNSYLIKFPTNGQLIDIESRKSLFSSGTYSSLMRSTLLSAGDALDLIDMISTLSVTCPKLMGDLRVDSLMDLTPIQTIVLVKEFKEKYVPWFNGWIKYYRQEVEGIEEIPANV